MTLADAAGWIAPAATMIAAMMTAANLGARITGWGFVIFTIGSVAWTTVGMSSGQTNLIAANGFLTVVNIVGIWRWLGREARYRDDAAAVADESAEAPQPTLTPAASLIGQPVRGPDGDPLATIVDAMISCDDARVHGLLVTHGGGIGGVGERVVMLTDRDFRISADGVTAPFSADRLDALPEVKRPA